MSTKSGWCLTGHHKPDKDRKEGGHCPVVSRLSGRKCGCECHTEEEITAATEAWTKATGGVDKTWTGVDFPGTSGKGRGRKRTTKTAAADEPTSTKAEDDDSNDSQAAVDAEPDEDAGEGVREGREVDGGVGEGARDLA